MERRKGHLEDSLRLQQFYRSAEEEQQWVRECRPQAASTDYGKTMSQVEKLQKKHQVGEGGWGGAGRSRGRGEREGRRRGEGGGGESAEEAPGGGEAGEAGGGGRGVYWGDWE